MAVSPLRALTVAQLESTWNRLRKQQGRGLWGLVLLVVALSLTVMGPLVLGSGLTGFAITLIAINAPEQTELAIALASVVLTGITFGVGVMGGLATGSRQLPWEVLRGFPVRDLTLFVAELVAGAGELITLVELAMLGAFCLGGLIASPSWGWVLLAAGHWVLLLTLQLLAGSLAQRLSRGLRATLALLPILGLGMAWAGPLVGQWLRQSQSAQWHERVQAIGPWMPSHALVSVAFGQPASWVGVLGFVALTVGIGALSFRLVARERPLSTEVTDRRPHRLWSFRSQTMGVARLQLETLLRSLPGRFGLLMPLFTLVLIRGPLRQALFSSSAWSAPIAFGYAALASTNLLFNQFGLDRHGVKVLFLLPIEPGALLRGKWLGFLGWHALQASVLMALLLLSGERDLFSVAVGVCLSLCIFLVFSMVGQLTSLWAPRPLRKNGTRAAQPPLTVVLAMLGTLLTTFALIYGLLFGVRAFAPGFELVAMGGLAVVLLGLSFPIQAFNTLLLERSREKLVETLAASG